MKRAGLVPALLVEAPVWELTSSDPSLEGFLAHRKPVCEGPGSLRQDSCNVSKGWYVATGV